MRSRWEAHASFSDQQPALGTHHRRIDLSRSGIGWSADVDRRLRGTSWMTRDLDGSAIAGEAHHPEHLVRGIRRMPGLQRVPEQVGIAVSNIDRSIHWYHDVLGLERAFEEAWGSYPAVL